jgi:hypothetical protein
MIVRTARVKVGHRQARYMKKNRPAARSSGGFLFFRCEGALPIDLIDPCRTHQPSDLKNEKKLLTVAEKHVTIYVFADR